MSDSFTAGFSAQTLREAIAKRLSELGHRDINIGALTTIAADRAEGELKNVGYGQPLLVSFTSHSGEHRLVFRTAGPNWFGHDRRADRADLALLAADSYAELPDHIQVLDVGGITRRGELVSLSEVGEFYFVTTFVEGELYASDLRRIEQRGRAVDLDLERVRALARYLATLHRRPVVATPEVYQRALRDLVGSGEGIFGITDSYPESGPVPRARLLGIEQLANEARHRLRDRHHRVRLTHGDFHPYNLLFREGTEFSVIDASRGGRGDPADDLAALSINYLFGGIVSPGAWVHGHLRLWRELWASYLDETGDVEVLETIAPFFAWRLLVVASPVWYPSIEPAARDRLLSIAEHVLRAPSLDIEEVAAMVG